LDCLYICLLCLFYILLPGQSPQSCCSVDAGYFFNISPHGQLEGVSSHHASLSSVSQYVGSIYVLYDKAVYVKMKCISEHGDYVTIHSLNYYLVTRHKHALASYPKPTGRRTWCSLFDEGYAWSNRQRPKDTSLLHNTTSPRGRRVDSVHFRVSLESGLLAIALCVPFPVRPFESLFVLGLALIINALPCGPVQPSPNKLLIPRQAASCVLPVPSAQFSLGIFHSGDLFKGLEDR
jgi:hypothetical protein